MSRIKVCFIPPKGMTDYAKQGDMLMCLAQELDDPEYSATMYRLSEDKFTLLDNGANEGKALNNDELAMSAERIEADEIVLPDVLHDSLGTYEASMDYLKLHRNQSFSYMGVVQGNTYDELQLLVDKYARQSNVTTVGLPRLLVEHMHLSARINMAIWINEEFPRRFGIHFLGASSAWVKEPYYVAKYGLNVRSIDTSLPFNYGLAGVALEDALGVTEKKINRPKDYFTRSHALSGLTVVLFNMGIYKEWCNGTKTPSGSVR